MKEAIEEATKQIVEAIGELANAAGSHSLPELAELIGNNIPSDMRSLNHRNDGRDFGVADILWMIDIASALGDDEGGGTSLDFIGVQLQRIADHLTNTNSVAKS